MRGILLRIHARDSLVLPRIFGDEFRAVSALMRSEPEAGYGLLERVYADTNRRALWREKFRVLGAESIARQEYERYAFESNAWLRPPVKRLYDSLIDDAPERATEIDYAFFLDRAMHMSITGAGLAQCRAVLAAERTRLGRPLTPAERRRAISHALVPRQQKLDRLGRDVVYFVDGIGEANLTADERDAWSTRTGRRASDCGLDDERMFYPDFLQSHTR